MRLTFTQNYVIIFVSSKLCSISEDRISVTEMKKKSIQSVSGW